MSEWSNFQSMLCQKVLDEHNLRLLSKYGRNEWGCFWGCIHHFTPCGLQKFFIKFILMTSSPVFKQSLSYVFNYYQFLEKYKVKCIIKSKKLITQMPMMSGCKLLIVVLCVWFVEWKDVYCTHKAEVIRGWMIRLLCQML